MFKIQKDNLFVAKQDDRNVALATDQYADMSIIYVRMHLPI